MIKIMKRRGSIKLVLGFFLVLPFFFSGPKSLAGTECKIVIVSAGGVATARYKAERNSRISLITKLHRRYPGDVKSRLRGRISYHCKNPLLWSCRASVKICE